MQHNQHLNVEELVQLITQEAAQIRAIVAQQLNISLPLQDEALQPSSSS